HATAVERDCLMWHVSSGGEVVGWYRRDDNAVPAVYVLQPRTGTYLDDIVWGTEELRVRRHLLEIVDRIWTPCDPRRMKYVASATHQEILHGALRAVDAENHVFCYFRDFETLPEPADREASAFFDMLPNGEMDRDAARRLRIVRHQLHRKFS